LTKSLKCCVSVEGSSNIDLGFGEILWISFWFSHKSLTYTRYTMITIVIMFSHDISLTGNLWFVLTIPQWFHKGFHKYVFTCEHQPSFDEHPVWLFFSLNTLDSLLSEHVCLLRK
jgi:hypothetical protein